MFQSQFVITNKCNLSCKYCYMHNNKNKMDSDIFKISYHFIEQQLKQQVFNNNMQTRVSFFGGEPLLNLDLIRDNEQLIKQINGYMPTNGLLLTSDNYEYLKSLGINLSISFDGDEGSKLNRTNLKHNSFQKEIMKKENVNTVIYPNLFTKLSELYLYFNSIGIQSPNFSLVLEDIYTEKDINNYKESLKELYILIKRKYKDENILSIPSMINNVIFNIINVGKHKIKKPYGCYAGNTGVGIDIDGKIYPCARFATNKSFELADSITKKINYDVIREFKEKTNPYNYRKCKKCNYYMICNGGCSYIQSLNNFEPVDSLCNIFKLTINTAIKIYKEFKNDSFFIDYIKNKMNGN